MKKPKKSEGSRGKMMSAEDFVVAWQSSATKAEVAEKVGTTVAGITARSTRYRKLGVPLKKFPAGTRRGEKRLDVEKLAALAKKTAGGKG